MEVGTNFSPTLKEPRDCTSVFLVKPILSQVRLVLFLFGWVFSDVQWRSFRVDMFSDYEMYIFTTKGSR